MTYAYRSCDKGSCAFEDVDASVCDADITQCKHGTVWRYPIAVYKNERK